MLDIVKKRVIMMYIFSSNCIFILIILCYNTHIDDVLPEFTSQDKSIHMTFHRHMISRK